MRRHLAPLAVLVAVSVAGALWAGAIADLIRRWVTYEGLGRTEWYRPMSPPGNSSYTEPSGPSPAQDAAHPGRHLTGALRPPTRPRAVAMPRRVHADATT